MTVGRLGAGQAFSQLGRDTGRIVRNSADAMIHNPNALKRNSLPVAMLLLVASRIAIAHITARRAKGTDQEQFRFIQDVRTALRESTGWVCSYLLLRIVEAGVRMGINRTFGLREDKTPSAFAQFRAAIRRAWKRQPPPPPADPLKVLMVSTVERPLNPNLKVLAKARKFLSYVPVLGKKVIGMENEALMRGILRWAPPILAVAPTVAMSGYMVERFVRDDSDKVVNAVCNMMGKGAPIQAGTSHVHRDAFTRFRQSIEQKATERNNSV